MSAAPSTAIIDRPTPLDFFIGQEQLDPGRRNAVIAARAEARFDDVTPDDVRAALEHPRRTRRDLAALLSPAAAPLLEEIAAQAQRETRARFGTSV